MFQNNPAKINTVEIFERDILKKIYPFISKKEILSIIGPRQAGKTTVLQILFNQLKKEKKSLFLTFEKIEDREIFEKDIENFKELYVEPYDIVFIDEFQYAENAGQKLKYLYDTTKAKFIITGSSSLAIKDIGKYLVGRVFTFYLFPLNFSEFLRVKDSTLFNIVKKEFDKVKAFFEEDKSFDTKDSIKSSVLKNRLKEYFFEYLIFGGYPRVIKSDDIDEKRVVLSSIVENYLLREIRSLLHLATENELLRLAKFLSLQIGNLISYGELSASSGLNHIAVKKHLNILKETFVVDFVYPFYTNKRIELVKSPKVYFLDLGFRNKVIDNFSSFDKRSDLGALVENFVFNELRSRILDFGRINFWRTKSQAEVDFVVEKDGKLIPIEVKFTSAKRKVIGKSLFSFIEKYKPEKAIVTASDFYEKRTVGKTKVYFVPVFYI